MALCKWNEDKKTLEPAEPVKLSAKGLKERDLQHVVRDTPEVLEEGLFVIAEEYSNWEGSGRSIDLLALDEKGRLVVVELKRTPTGNHMDLQAVRYAAMVSNMTDDQVVQAHRKYLASRNRKIDAAAEIRAHLDGANEDARVDSKFPRILLASGGFSIELTTSVLWLNDNGLDIKCVRLDLYQSDKRLYLDGSQVIPIPQAQDYQIRIRDKDRERRARRKDVEEYPGSEKFHDGIQSAPRQEEITKLYKWAMKLQTEKLCSDFVTTFSRTRDGYGLKPLLPERNKNPRACLITIYYKPAGFPRPGPPQLAVWRQWFEEYAPDSIQRVEEEIGGPIGDGNLVKRPLTDALLEALFKAHEEAAGNIKKRSE